MKHEILEAEIRDSLTCLEVVIESMGTDLMSDEARRDTSIAIHALRDFKFAAYAYLDWIQEKVRHDAAYHDAARK